MKISVIGERCTIVDGQVFVAGAKKVYPVEFIFDNSWDGYTATAVFESAGSEPVSQLLVDGKCIVPWEVLIPNVRFRVGVFGVKDNIERPTIWTHYLPVADGTEDAPEAQPDPTPGMYTQMLQLLNKHEQAEAIRVINEEARKDAEDVRQDAEAKRAAAESHRVANDARRELVWESQVLAAGNHADEAEASAKRAEQAVAAAQERAAATEDLVRDAEASADKVTSLIDSAYNAAARASEAEAAAAQSKADADASKQAAQSARDAAVEVAEHPPIPGEVYWELWNPETEQYEVSDIRVVHPVYPDWQENDPDSPNYIKNQPRHLAADGSMTLLEHRLVGVTGGPIDVSMSFDPGFRLVVGTEYSGELACKGYEDDPIIFYGTAVLATDENPVELVPTGAIGFQLLDEFGEPGPGALFQDTEGQMQVVGLFGGPEYLFLTLRAHESIDPRGIPDMYHSYEYDELVYENWALELEEPNVPVIVDAADVKRGFQVGDYVVMYLNGVDYSGVAVELDGLPTVKTGARQVSYNPADGTLSIQSNMAVSTRVCIGVRETRVKQIDPKYLPEIETVTSWNDLEDKPFYTGYSITELLPEMTVAFESPEMPLPAVVPLEAGHAYTVKWKGTEYPCTAQSMDMEGIPCAVLGDFGAMTGGDSTGEPFVLLAIPEEYAVAVGVAGMVMALDGSASATFSIIGEAEVVHKIDNKYLDMDWIPTSEPGVALVENRIVASTSYLPAVATLPTVGQLLVVYYDGLRYEREVVEVQGNIVVGNPGVFGLDGLTNTGEPFAVAFSGDSTLVVFADGGEHEIAIIDPSGSGSVYRKIPSGYLPLAGRDTYGVIKTTSSVTAVTGHTACPIIDGVPYYKNATSTLSSLGITATASELNKLHGVTATTTELNKLHGVTATTTELNYVDGVTGNIQAQLNEKQPKITGAASTVTAAELTANRVLVSTAAGKIGAGGVTTTELNYVSGVTGNIQTQLNKKPGRSVNGESFDIEGAGTAAGGIGAEIFNDYVNNKAVGNYSHAEGGGTTASGTWSHAEGGDTTASGAWSHAEGSSTVASGLHAHAEGSGTTASGSNSHAEGFSTHAASSDQHVQGKYNIPDADGVYAHIVGNGSPTRAANVHTLDWVGRAWFAGNIYVGGDGQEDDNATKLLLVGTQRTGEIETVIPDYTGTVNSNGFCYIPSSAMSFSGFTPGDKYVVTVNGYEYQCLCSLSMTNRALGGDNVSVNSIHYDTGEYRGLMVYLYNDRKNDADGNPLTEVTFSVKHYATKNTVIPPEYLPEVEHVIMTSPSGKKFKLAVADDGTLSTTEVT